MRRDSMREVGITISWFLCHPACGNLEKSVCLLRLEFNLNFGLTFGVRFS
jgi:hypothetical protein